MAVFPSLSLANRYSGREVGAAKEPSSGAASRQPRRYFATSTRPRSAARCSGVLLKSSFNEAVSLAPQCPAMALTASTEKSFR